MKQEFQRKTLAHTIYRWSPQPIEVSKRKRVHDLNDKEGEFCDAAPLTNGEDWVVTYMYIDVLVNNQITRPAYVACDYVQ